MPFPTTPPPLSLLSIWQSILIFENVSSVAQSCPTHCDPMDCSPPGFPVLHLVLKLTHTHVLWISDAIQPSHPLSSPSLPAFSLSQHRGLFQWIGSSHQVAKILALKAEPLLKLGPSQQKTRDVQNHLPAVLLHSSKEILCNLRLLKHFYMVVGCNSSICVNLSDSSQLVKSLIFLKFHFEA